MGTLLSSATGIQDETYSAPGMWSHDAVEVGLLFLFCFALSYPELLMLLMFDDQRQSFQSLQFVRVS